MARKPRVFYPGGLYHIICRGNHRQVTFLDEPDYTEFLHRISFYKERYQFLFYAFILMPNHIHLLIEMTDAPLSKIMQGITQSYTQYFNKRHIRVGHLFQGRYKAILCDKDSYLLELVRYIHLNPVRAKMVERPEDYRWSSHINYLGNAAGLVERDFVLQIFSRNMTEAVSAYKDFIADRISEGFRRDLYKTKEQIFLGEEDFVQRVSKEIQREPSIKVGIGLEEILTMVCNAYGINMESLFEKSHNASRLRFIATYLTREVAGIPLSRVADYLRRDPATLSLGVRRLRELMDKDATLKEEVFGLETRLRGKQNIKA